MSEEHPKTFKEGRRCSIEGCGTKLSIYNPNNTCAPCRERLAKGAGTPNPLSAGKSHKDYRTKG